MSREAAVEAALEAYRFAARYIGTELAIIEALDAAAPHMLAAAWDEGREAEEYRGYYGLANPNPYRSQA